MITYKVKNGAHRGKAFKVAGGLQIVASGESAEVETKDELTSEQRAAYTAAGVSIREVKTDNAEKKPEPPKAAPSKPAGKA